VRSLIALLILFASQTGWTLPEEPPEEIKKTEWTVYIYMNGDNSLSYETYADLYEMENIGSSVSVNFIVYHDSAEDSGSRYIHIQQNPAAKTEALIFRRKTAEDFYDLTEEEIFETELLSPTVHWIPEQDSGNIETVFNFMDWGMEHYPSKKTAFILWNHGEGWTSEGPSKGGIAYDDSWDGSEGISIYQLRELLTRLSDKYLEGERFDVYGSDACLMEMIEVVYELKDCARFIIGSVALEPLAGWPYTTILRALVDAPYGRKKEEEIGVGADSAYQWALKIPPLFQSSYSKYAGSINKHDPWATMATISADGLTSGPKLTSFADVLNTFGDALVHYIKAADKESIFERRTKITQLMEDTFSFEGLPQDLFDFTTLILNDLLMDERRKGLSPRSKDLQIATADLQNKIGEVVLSRGVSPEYYEEMGEGTTKGLAIWLPSTRTEFEEFFDEFKLSRLYQDPKDPEKFGGWAQFLQYLHAKRKIIK